MRMRRSRRASDAAEAFQLALEVSESYGRPVGDELVQVARMLAPSTPIRETARNRTAEQMMRVFHATLNSEQQSECAPGCASAGPVAGSRDLWEPEVHTAAVETDRGVIRMADVERFGTDRAAEVARRVEARVEGLMVAESSWEEQ